MPCVPRGCVEGQEQHVAAREGFETQATCEGDDGDG